MCMNSCQDDRYKEIQQTYGTEFQRYIVREKCRAFFFRTIAKLKKNVSLSAQTQEKIFLREISQAQEQVYEYFKQVSKELNEKQLGGISSLQQMTGKNVESILRYEQLLQSFQKFRKSTQQAIKEEQIQIIDELTHFSLEYQQAYQKEEEPSNYFFSSLPQAQKDSIIKRASMEYESEISTMNEYLLDKYQQQLKFDHYRQRLSNNDFHPQLQKLVSLSKDRLLTNLNRILGETVQTYILIK